MTRGRALQVGDDQGWLSVLGKRCRFVHGPTPLVRMPRVAERMGLDLWIKRDDLTGGVEGGSKLRKLEFFVADALSQRADVLVTSGNIQSNHARATAIVAASLGLRCELCLWSRHDDPIVPSTGNGLLTRMTGAAVQWVGELPWSQREDAVGEMVRGLVRRGLRPYVIPEGGSNGLGSLGYVQACREIRRQMDRGIGGGVFDVIVHPCGSGGTTAGLALGAGAFGIAREVLGLSVVSDDVSLTCMVGRVIEEARGVASWRGVSVPWRVQSCGDCGSLGRERRRFILEMGHRGLFLDPVYTGPALHGLAEIIRRDGRWVGRKVLFVHTGGVPLLFAKDWGLADD